MEYFNFAVRIRRAIPTGRIIRTPVREQYDKYKQTVIDLLRESPGKIHISFDGWTSLNQAALYGIVCLFRNEQNQPQKLLLGMPQAFRHFSSTITAEVLDVIKAYGIQDKIGYFTLDNAENNITTMEVIDGELVSVDDLQEPKAQVAGAAHTLSVCKRHLAHKLLPLQQSTLHHHN
jgi:hypothetical protein